jgi:DNA-binding response OmpR family regulator
MTIESGEVSRSRYHDCFPFLVEDDEDFRSLLRRAFVKAGVSEQRTRVAVDGAEAVQSLEFMMSTTAAGGGLLPSLIVLDVGLPKLSGIEVLKWIRNCPRLSGVPIFMLSSNEFSSPMIRDLRFPATSYFVKPGAFRQLESTVERMLELWRSCAAGRAGGDGL